MTLHEYSLLSIYERDELISSSAEFVCEIHEDHTSSFFYALHSFFVEVVLEESAIGIAEAIPFNEGERYERMLEGITLDV